MSFANDVLEIITDGTDWDSDTMQSIADAALEYGLVTTDAAGYLIMPEENKEE